MLNEKMEESNIQIEINCGYTKGDEFIGFQAHRQMRDGQFMEGQAVKIECPRVNGMSEITIVDFYKYGDDLSKVQTIPTRASSQTHEISSIDKVKHIIVFVKDWD